SAPRKVMVNGRGPATATLPVPMLGRASRAFWMLVCSVAAVALQVIGPVVNPLKDSVKVPPVIVPPKVIVWTALTAFVPPSRPLGPLRTRLPPATTICPVVVLAAVSGTRPLCGARLLPQA